MWYPSLSPKSIQYPFPRIKGEDPLELFCVIFVLCVCVFFFFALVVVLFSWVRLRPFWIDSACTLEIEGRITFLLVWTF